MISATAQAAEQLTNEQLETVTAGKFVNYSAAQAGSQATSQSHGNQAGGSVYTGNGWSTSTSFSSSH